MKKAVKTAGAKSANKQTEGKQGIKAHQRKIAEEKSERLKELEELAAGKKFREWLESIPGHSHPEDLIGMWMDVRLHAHLWVDLYNIARSNNWGLEHALSEALSEGIERWDIERHREEKERAREYGELSQMVKRLADENEIRDRLLAEKAQTQGKAASK